MRRLGVTCAILMLALLFQTAASFAAGTLQIMKTHPQDGATGIYPLNFAIKVSFDRDVSSAKGMYVNNNSFVVTGPADPETNRPEVIMPTVLYDPKNPEMVLVVINQDLEANTEYKLTISGDFTTAQGNVLGDDYIIRFTTRDMSRDMQTSMIMMMVFLVIIMIITTKQAKRKAQKEAEEKDKKRKVNPYKVSKETGKSVTEIVEKDEKQKRKKAAEEAKLKVKEPEYDDEYEYEDEYDEYYEENDNHRVAGPRRISMFSKYKSGKKAKAEAAKKKAEAAAKAKAAAGTTNPKNQSGKSKNKKKK